MLVEQVALISRMDTCILHGWVCTVHGCEICLEDICRLHFVRGSSLVNLLRREESLHAVLLDHGAPMHREPHNSTNVSLFLIYTYICIVAFTENTHLLS